MLAGVLTVALVLAVVTAATVGSSGISAGNVWSIVTGHVVPGATIRAEALGDDAIVWGIRLPRAVLAAVVGASLAVVGAALQALVRNPLADPTILGGSSGASLGAVLVLLLGWTPLGQWSLIGAAFTGSLVGYGLTLLLASRAGMLSPVRLILAGVAVSYLLGAATNLAVSTTSNPNRVRSVVFWQLGSLAGAQWRTMWGPLVILVVGTVALLARTRGLNALLAGDETATSVGIRPDQLRRQLVVVSALLTGAAVAVAGTIAFVGLVVPHAVRSLVGSDHARLLPICALSGAVFLVLVDIAARVVIAPQELPVGVVTALIGAPAFCVLYRRRVQER